MLWRRWMTSCRKSWAEMIPNDPVILLSFVNARLRDEYDSLEERLAAIGYLYNETMNQFK